MNHTSAVVGNNSITWEVNSSVEHHGRVATEAEAVQLEPHWCQLFTSEFPPLSPAAFTIARATLTHTIPAPAAAEFPPSRKPSVTSAGVGFALGRIRRQKESFRGMHQQLGRESTHVAAASLDIGGKLKVVIFVSGAHIVQPFGEYYGPQKGHPW